MEEENKILTEELSERDFGEENTKILGTSHELDNAEDRVNKFLANQKDVIFSRISKIQECIARECEKSEVQFWLGKLNEKFLEVKDLYIKKFEKEGFLTEAFGGFSQFSGIELEIEEVTYTVNNYKSVNCEKKQELEGQSESLDHKAFREKEENLILFKILQIRRAISKGRGKFELEMKLESLQKQFADVEKEHLEILANNNALREDTFSWTRKLEKLIEELRDDLYTHLEEAEKSKLVLNESSNTSTGMEDQAGLWQGLKKYPCQSLMETSDNMITGLALLIA